MEKYELRDGLGNKIQPPRLEIAKAWSSWTQKADKASKYLSDVLERDVLVDEIAVLFGSSVDAQHWVSQQVENSLVTHFNASNDHVQTTPIVSEYDVRYDFLRVEGSGMRVEAMHLLNGHSPIHVAAIERLRLNVWDDFLPVPFHFSFKCESADAYYETTQRLHQEPDFALVQGCRSTYGVFSYWATSAPEMASVPLYLKPRANLRDAA